MLEFWVQVNAECLNSLLPPHFRGEFTFPVVPDRLNDWILDDGTSR